jgi:hypothetical protein
LLTTTIDRDWADLALRPGFVPLVATLLPYLAGQRRTDTLESIEPGVPWPIRSESAATIETPSGREVASAPDKDAQILFRDTSEVGHYLVRGESTDGAFVVNVSAEESITDRVEVAVAQADGNDGQQAVVTSVPRWRLLALLGALVLLLESGFRLWALRRRR